jgi:hypothetical protein
MFRLMRYVERRSNRLKGVPISRSSDSWEWPQWHKTCSRSQVAARIPNSILAQARSSALPAPTASITNIAQNGQSESPSGMALFNAKFTAETKFQHRIIWDQLSLHPQASIWSEDAKRTCIMQIWTNRYKQWERSIELGTLHLSGRTPEGRADPICLLVKAYGKNTPPNGPLDEASYQQYIAKASHVSMENFLDTLRWWRTDFANMFAEHLPLENLMPASTVEH